MTYLSEVFKYISFYRKAGHQIGRKVGDMLELLTFGSLLYDDNLKSRLNIEPKLFGFSDAGHKVEFVISKNNNFDINGEALILNGGEISHTETILGFIECKKVGVEQTINGKFKKQFSKDTTSNYYKIPYDENFTINFSPRNSAQKYKYHIKIDKERINIFEENTKLLIKEKLVDNHRIIFTLSDKNESKVLKNDQSLRSYKDNLKSCKILDISIKQNEYCLGLLNDCLSGPQTPEKAKQASFVALDVRKKRFNSFDIRHNEEEMLSILVLTEFSHWEIKSQKMIKACIDKNLIISDKLLIKAFKEFEEIFGD
ncbi:hypothetical protein [Prochlorococcus sp. MIT 1223]|uniref:hypothetical protein n=1 Tax=Prochlorococcus sp. MIT 1223 TaxID=3096217 RepID=UPI002A7575D2|nr:hypothetical protein [Prochlorococcus sp. MIT 1223]